jgi:metal-responsive CopG/Arc/MetJ family transcriptional regulator
MNEEKKGKGRPKKNSKEDTPVLVRLEYSIIDQLDLLSNQETVRTKYNITRSDIIRRAIVEYLENNSIQN